MEMKAMREAPQIRAMVHDMDPCVRTPDEARAHDLEFICFAVLVFAFVYYYIFFLTVTESASVCYQIRTLFEGVIRINPLYVKDLCRA